MLLADVLFKSGLIDAISLDEIKRAVREVRDVGEVNFTGAIALAEKPKPVEEKEKVDAQVKKLATGITEHECHAVCHAMFVALLDTVGEVGDVIEDDDEKKRVLDALPEAWASAVMAVKEVDDEYEVFYWVRAFQYRVRQMFERYGNFRAAHKLVYG